MLRHITSWLTAPRPARPAVARLYRPALEALERREVMSAANDQFLGAVYADLLGKGLSQATYQQQTQRLNLGIPRFVLALELQGTTDFYKREAARIYQHVFGSAIGHAAADLLVKYLGQGKSPNVIHAS